jgi:hypothetical protein
MHFLAFDLKISGGFFYNLKKKYRRNFRRFRHGIPSFKDILKNDITLIHNPLLNNH